MGWSHFGDAAMLSKPCRRDEIARLMAFGLVLRCVGTQRHLESIEVDRQHLRRWNSLPWPLLLYGRRRHIDRLRFLFEDIEQRRLFLLFSGAVVSVQLR